MWWSHYFSLSAKANSLIHSISSHRCSTSNCRHINSIHLYLFYLLSTLAGEKQLLCTFSIRMCGTFVSVCKTENARRHYSEVDVLSRDNIENTKTRLWGGRLWVNIGNMENSQIKPIVERIKTKCKWGKKIRIYQSNVIRSASIYQRLFNDVHFSLCVRAKYLMFIDFRVNEYSCRYFWMNDNRQLQ